MSATLQSWARTLGGEVSGGQVLCPGPWHGPADRSLSVKMSNGGFIVHSFAGDDPIVCRDYVAGKLGLPPFKPNGSRKTVAEYEFRDTATGAVHYRKERVEAADGTKSFFFKPSGRNGSEPLLYGGERLADLAEGQQVFIVEGEKKVDRLRELGAVAVSGDTGASSKWLPAHAKLLRGLRVILWPDSDAPGEEYVACAATAIRDEDPHADIRVVRPFGPPNGAKGRDVIDWAASGGTREQLHAMVDNDARPWAPSESVIAGPSPDTKPRKITASPYVWRNPKTIPPREFLYGKFYIRKFISTIVAAGGIGKTSLALVEAIAMATGRSFLGVPVPERLRVWYWNGEDPKDETERRIAAILLHFKIAPEEVEGRLFTDSGREAPICIAEPHKDGVIFGPDANALSEEISAKKIDVFILDPFVKTHAVSENINGAIDLVARKYAGIADEANCAIGLAHHVRKATGNGRVEVTIDDARGAGSLVDAARSNRVLNVMTTDEATAAQVKPEQRKSYFRADDGKANMAAPAEAATWFKIVSTGLGNHEVFGLGDFVGVVTSWALPGVFAGVTTDDLPKVQAAIDGGSWAKNAGAEDWAGYAIARVLEIDLDDDGAKVRVTKLLSAWLKSKALAEELRPDPKRAWRKRPTIIVGARAI